MAISSQEVPNPLGGVCPVLEAGRAVRLEPPAMVGLNDVGQVNSGEAQLGSGTLHFKPVPLYVQGCGAQRRIFVLPAPFSPGCTLGGSYILQV